MNRTISFRTEMSTLLRKYTLSFVEPYLLGRPVSSRTSITREEREEYSVETGDSIYRITKHTFSTGVEMFGVVIEIQACVE